jgi:hypothetical protein
MAGDQASPPAINVPALRTSPPHTLHVPAHGRASVLLPGLPDGRYVIVIDHGGLASLVVGGAPGP